MPNVRADRMHRIVSIEQETVSTDGGGDRTVTNTVLYSGVPANIAPVSAREFIGGQAVQSEITHVVTIRYHSGITTAMRVKYGTRVFNIIAVLDEDEGKRMLQLMCKEQT